MKLALKRSVISAERRMLRMTALVNVFFHRTRQVIKSAIAASSVDRR